MQVADVITPSNLLLSAGLSAIGLMVRSVLSKQEKHGEKIDKVEGRVTELRVTLIGIDGQNGMRQDIRDLRTDLEHVKRANNLSKRATDTSE